MISLQSIFRSLFLPHWTKVCESTLDAMRYSSGSILHLGSGTSPIDGAVTCDYCQSVSPDIVHDLNVFPYPFEENSFDCVVAISVLEHLDDLFSVMEEVHRIVKPSGRVVIMTPHFSSSAANVDPSHTIRFSERSFDYFVEGTEICQNFGFYTKVRYLKKASYIGLQGWLNKVPLLGKLVNAYPSLWEDYLCYVLRGSGVYYELVAVKA